MTDAGRPEPRGSCGEDIGRDPARVPSEDPVGGEGKPCLLYVSTFFPYPATGGGKLRVSNLLSRLSRTYAVHYLSLGLNDEERSAEAIAKAEPYCESITVIPHKMNRIRAGLNVFLTLRPYEISLFDNAELAAALRRLVADLKPDVLWFSRLATARYLDDKGGALAVLDQHDLTSQLWRLMRTSAPQRWVRLFATVNGYLVERCERRIYPRFDVSVSVSDAERDLTRKHVLDGASSPVLITAPNGVDIDVYTPAASTRSGASRDVVLTGTMNHRRNVDAAVYFATEIFPQLALQFETLRFVVVGKDPSREVLDLGRMPGVLVTGAVPDVRPYLEAAEVVVAPFRFGSGVKHKVPIAMAMEKAIVSTRNGVQGLDVVHGRHLMIADTPADFAEHVATLLRTPELGAALGLEARRLAVERYSWDGIAAALVAEVEAIRHRAAT